MVGGGSDRGGWCKGIDILMNNTSVNLSHETRKLARYRRPRSAGKPPRGGSSIPVTSDSWKLLQDPDSSLCTTQTEDLFSMSGKASWHHTHVSSTVVLILLRRSRRSGGRPNACGIPQFGHSVGRRELSPPSSSQYPVMQSSRVLE